MKRPFGKGSQNRILRGRNLIILIDHFQVIMTTTNDPPSAYGHKFFISPTNGKTRKIIDLVSFQEGTIFVFCCRNLFAILEGSPLHKIEKKSWWWLNSWKLFCHPLLKPKVCTFESLDKGSHHPTSQIIATSHERFPPKGSFLEGESSYFGEIWVGEMFSFGQILQVNLLMFQVLHRIYTG